MRATQNGCEVYIGDELLAGVARASIAYETNGPGLFVVRSREAGRNVGPFHERLRINGVERETSESSSRQRRVIFVARSEQTYGDITVAEGEHITAVCTSGCSSCGQR